MALGGRKTHRNIFKPLWLRRGNISAGRGRVVRMTENKTRIITFCGRIPWVDVIIGLHIHPTLS